MFIGDSLWAYFEILFNIQMSLSVYIIPYIFQVSLLCVALLVFPRPEMPHIKRLRRIVDIGIVLFSFFMGLWTIMVDPIVNLSKSDISTFLIAVCFITLLFALTYIIIGVFFRNAGQLKGKPISFVLLGASLQILAAATFGYQSLQGDYISGGLGDFIFVSSYLFIGLGGMLHIIQSQKSPKNRLGHEKMRDCSKRAGYMNLPYTEYIPNLFAISAYILVIWIYFSNQRIFLDILFTASVIVGLVLFRQILSLEISKRSQMIAKENDEKLQAFFDNTSDAIIIVSKEGIITQWNRGAEKMYGYWAEEAIGQNVEMIMPFEYTENHKRSFNKMILEARVQTSGKVYEFISKKKDGSEFPVELSMSLLSTATGKHMAAIIRDVSERKNYEKSLQITLNRFYNILSSMHTAILLVAENNTVEFVNQAFCDYYDFKESHAELIGVSASEIIGKIKNRYQYPENAVERINELVNTRKLVLGEEVPMKDDKTYLRDFVPLSIKGEPHGRLWIHMDITERKKSEKEIQESEEKFRGVFNNANDAIFLHPILPGNIPGHFTEINDVACQMLGYTYEELLNMGPEDIDSPKDIDNILPIMDELLEKGRNTFEVIHLTKGGQEVPTEIKSHIFQLQGQDMILSIGRDITRRKIYEKRMEKSLEEKELLLKEIHHRVKNHLQIISSLITLQSMGIEDDNINQYLVKIQNRVRAIALLHENLYQSRDVSQVDFRTYVEKILNNLLNSYKTESKEINIVSNIESLHINIETASTCGIIINEVVTNCIKHAFPANYVRGPANGTFASPEKDGEIIVEFKDEGDQYRLKISDNGIGIPEDLDHRKTETLGLRLINNLAMQLEGTVEIKENHGTVFNIVFQELKYKERI
ncbi:MAG TPA: PAS domain S-box protein, partial [Methanobacterium sp.]|nr:PAS domain S-box protein [Methanobacterium sp.]